MLCREDMKTPHDSHSVPGADPHRCSGLVPQVIRENPTTWEFRIVALHLLLKLDHFGW